MSVFVTTYEATGEALEVIEQFRASVTAHLDRCWAITKEIGAEGFQPGWFGIRAMVFNGDGPADTPAGWRYLERDTAAGKIRCAPRKNTKAGKELAKRFDAVGKMPKFEDVADKLGWSPPHMPCDGNRVFFPVQQTVKLPSERHFVRLPRFEGDQWEGHPGLTPIPESEFMKAIEAHNACVRDLKASTTPGDPLAVAA